MGSQSAPCRRTAHHARAAELRTAWWTSALLLLAFAPLVGVLAEHAVPAPALSVRVDAPSTVPAPLTTAAGDDDPAEIIHRLSHHLLLAGLPGLAFCSCGSTPGSLDASAAVLPGVSFRAAPAPTHRPFGLDRIAPPMPDAARLHASRAPPARNAV